MDLRAFPVWVEGSRTFPLDSFRGVGCARGGSALKVPAQRSALAGRGAFERGRVKNHSPSGKHSPQTHHGCADTRV